MTDQPPQLKDPFAIEGDDAFVRDVRDRLRKSTNDGTEAESVEQVSSFAQHVPVLRDPFRREQTPVPESPPTTERLAKKRVDGEASTKAKPPTASHAAKNAAQKVVMPQPSSSTVPTDDVAQWS
jgi:hypothetical protein